MNNRKIRGAINILLIVLLITIVSVSTVSAAERIPATKTDSGQKVDNGQGNAQSWYVPVTQDSAYIHNGMAKQYFDNIDNGQGSTAFTDLPGVKNGYVFPTEPPSPPNGPPT